jgi:small subunit ribosomal protein S1
MEEKQINEEGLTDGGMAQEESTEPLVSNFADGGRPQEEPAEHPMNDLMEEALSFRKLRQGDIVDGEIVSVNPTEILIDVGAKSEGVVRGKELEGLGREGLDDLQVGDTIPVYIVRPEDQDGSLVLSLRRAEEESDWRRAQEMHEASDWFESQVAGFNKGGLIVRLGKLRGFVPASQLSREHQGRQNQQPEERWARLVGIPIRVKVIEINRRRKRLILSERAALREWREAQKEILLEELREGEVRLGVVSSLSDFGAFVDLGGADGLVHLSELSWNRAAKPADVLDVGQKVDVYVLGINREKKRIALSLKRLEPEPWSTVESNYYVGQLVEGTITRLTNFGAFALINDEIEGLIHISELSTRRINHPQEVVQEGEKHVMRIIRIDPKRRRMGLSLMRVTDPAYADLDWRAELAEAEASLEEETGGDLEEAATPAETDDVAGVPELVAEEEIPEAPEPAEVEEVAEMSEPAEVEEPVEAPEPAEEESQEPTFSVETDEDNGSTTSEDA